MFRNLMCAAVACAFAPAVFAAELGDPAAPLAIQEWVKGEPVDLAAGKGEKIHVVEFWATWCGPCRTSIPHLTELQAKYKDKGVVFVGVSDEDPAAVKPFVADQGANMDYVVAVDDNRKTSEGYMAAYGQNGIPAAFIVDKEGRVAWVGHPMVGLDEALEAMVAGTYDIATAKAEAAAEKEIQEKIEGLMELLGTGQVEQANAAAKATLEGSKNSELLTMTGWFLAAVRTPEDATVKPDYALAKQLIEAGMKGAKEESARDHAYYSFALMRTGDFDGALREIGKAIELEADPELKSQLEAMREQYKTDMVGPVQPPA